MIAGDKTKITYIGDRMTYNEKILYVLRDLYLYLITEPIYFQKRYSNQPQYNINSRETILKHLNTLNRWEGFWGIKR